MVLDAQADPPWHLHTPSRPLRSLIKRAISEALTAAAGIIGLIRLVSHALKNNVAPKATRNPGDKTEGVKTTRVGRDKGEPAGVNKRLTSIVGGAQDSLSARITPPSESNTLGKEFTLPSTSNNAGLRIENNESPTKPIQGIENLSEIEESNRETGENELGTPAGGKQFQTRQSDQIEQPERQNGEGTVNTSGPAAEKRDLHKSLRSPKRWGKTTGKDPQLLDWGKDSSNKFYSLTEESDFSSIDHSSGESEDSVTSEAGNKSSSNELTVRQVRRQPKPVKTRPAPLEGFENSTSMSGRTLKWDYSGIGLVDTPTMSKQDSVNGKMETDVGASAGNSSAMGTEAGILQSTYSSIKELQTETRIESRRARIATKRLQGTVRKVAKSCTEIEAKLCSMEERIAAVEEDVDTLKEQSASRDEQLTDVMWKMEDFENRQRRNNLRFLGIPEGLEGSNIQTYMVNLLHGAFPELGNWDWENELQRA
ncbi:hypothetical protein NDU88_000580 [Pleurodeles waltl]|uniref:Uncharacterized protein n=1 Tax=Pleurodeles waltl TaxID=8319 RepID=A0AAV7WJC1_PLEWA|nr:hypothetical protein NDU88_000580 [Pleurodeles waltl]